MMMRLQVLGGHHSLLSTFQKCLLFTMRGCAGSLLLCVGLVVAGRLIFLVLCRPLIAMASPAAKHRLSGTQASASETRGLSVVAHGLQSASSVAVPHSKWDLPRPGIELVSPTLPGGFLTTGPPGKPHHSFLKAVKGENESEVAQSCPAVCDPMDCIPCGAPPSMGFSRQEYWIGLPFPSPGNLPNSGIKPRSPALQAETLPSELPRKPILESRTSSNDGVVISRILTCSDAPNLASHEME